MTQSLSENTPASISTIPTQIKNELERSSQELPRSWQLSLVRLLLYIGIMLAVIGLAAFYARRTGLDFPTNLLLLAGILLTGVAGMELLVRWPVLAVVGLLLVTFFVNWWLKTGTNVSIDVTILAIAGLLGVWLLRILWVERRLNLAPLRIYIPALAFIVAAVMSLVLGNQRFGEQAAGGASLPAQFGGLVLLVFPVLLMLAAGSLIRSTKQLKLIVLLFLALGIFFAIGSLIPGLDKIILNVFHPNIFMSIFWIMLTAIPAGQAIFNKELSIRWRAVYLLLALIALAGGLRTTEKLANWIPLLIALLLMLWMWNWRWGLGITVVGFIFALPVILWLVYTPATIRIYELNLPWPYTGIINVSSEFSIRSRYATWPIMFELIKQSPFFGLGPANYKFFTNQYRIWEYFLPFNSHNNFWDLAAQTGLVGFGLFTWLSYEILRLAWKLRQQVQNGFIQGYATGMLTGFVGVLSAGMMDDYFMPFVYNIGFPGFRAAIFIWLFLGGLLSLEVHRQKTPAPQLSGPRLIS